MREDIKQAFWQIYEDEVHDELLNKGDTNISAPILNVNKQNVMKKWRERCMIMIPQVEQHQMVPFHDRWVNEQFESEENIRRMEERLSERMQPPQQHWLTDLVQAMTENVSPSSSQTTEPTLDNISEMLQELEEMHPEIFGAIDKDQYYGEDATDLQLLDAEEITDSDEELMEHVEEFKKAMNEYDYSYLMENEVSECNLVQY